jgi:hypothetical protein
MEWVPAKKGEIPLGRRPVEGGHEANGLKLYHAIGIVDGLKVPGKTAAHLGAASIPVAGEEIRLENYELL